MSLGWLQFADRSRDMGCSHAFISYFPGLSCMYVSLRLSVTRHCVGSCLTPWPSRWLGKRLEEVGRYTRGGKNGQTSRHPGDQSPTGTWTAPEVGSPREGYPKEGCHFQAYHTIRPESFFFLRRPLAFSDSVNYPTYHRPNLIKCDPRVPDLVVFQPCNEPNMS